VEAIESAREAIRAYDKLAEQNENEPHHYEGLGFAHIDLANALRGLGRPAREEDALKSALEDFEVLRRSMPDYPPYSDAWAVCHAALGRLCHWLGQNPKARKHLDTAVAELNRLVNYVSPLPSYKANLAAALTLRGQILRDLGHAAAQADFENARDQYSLLLGISPTEGAYFRSRGRCQRHYARFLHSIDRSRARRQYDEARRDLEKARELNPQDLYALDGLACCLEHSGDLRVADKESPRDDYEEAKRIRQQLCSDSATPEHKYKLAMLLLKLHEHDEALRLARELTTTASQDPNYWTLRGAAELLADDPAASVTALEKYPPNPGDGRRELWLAIALWTRNDRDDRDLARSIFEKGLTVMHQNAPAQLEVLEVRDQAADLLGVQPLSERTD
jgi:tetratricopeptide (TPR) repeat protein